MADFLIDTDVLIDISKASVKAADFVDNLDGSIFLSRISAMELIVGARDKRDQEIIEDFIESYEIKELSSSVGS